MVLFEAVVVPLVMAILAFVLFHRGSKEMTSSPPHSFAQPASPSVSAVYSFWSFTLPTYGNAQVHPRDRTSVAGLQQRTSTAILARDAAAFAFLLTGLVRKSRSRACEPDSRPLPLAVLRRRPGSLI